MTFQDDRIEEYRERARQQYLIEAARLIAEGNFVATSTHRNWRGKIKCIHCNATGYGGSVDRNPLWWGQYHGGNCGIRLS